MVAEAREILRIFAAIRIGRLIRGIRGWFDFSVSAFPPRGGHAQLSAAWWVVTGVKTFLKILLIALAVVIAIKLLPLTVVAGCVLVAAALAVVVVTASAAAVLFCIAVILAAVLAPIWLPVLAVIGIVSLVRKGRRGAAA